MKISPRPYRPLCCNFGLPEMTVAWHRRQPCRHN